jgi:hypothetical protein
MEAYIAEISEPAHPDVQFIEERKLIVLAESPEAAEAAFRKFAGPEQIVKMTGERPRPDYLKAANLQPGVVKGYNP